MFSTLIRAILGGLGIIKKTKKYTTENNDEFVKSISPCSIVLTSAINPNFIQGGIQGATDYFWQHALLYVGKTAGDMIRVMYPELLKNKKIPKEAKIHEIVEAQGKGVIVSTLDKNFGNTQQMVTYIRSISTVEMVKILFRIYSNVGKPYDYLEFLGDALPGLPIHNPASKFVCSSLVANAWLPIEKTVLKGVDVSRATPKDLNNYLEKNLNWCQTKYNW